MLWEHESICCDDSCDSRNKISIKSITYNALILLGYFYPFDFIVFSVGRNIVAGSTNSESKWLPKWFWWYGVKALI